MYLLFIYGKGKMKPAEIVLRRRGGRNRENNGGVNLTKIYCKHMCKYHNVSPCTTVIC
jgi:hypothetical protein